MNTLPQTLQTPEQIPAAGSPEGVYVAQTDTFVETLGDHTYRTNHLPPDLRPEDIKEEDLRLPFSRFVEDYADTLSSVVVHCVDISVVNEEGKMLIGTRQQEPQAGDWVIGGRMRAGETPRQTAENNLKRELKIPIDTDRISQKPVGNYQFIWDTRAQEPTTNEKGEEVTGCHTASSLMLYRVTSSEIDTQNHNEEYSKLDWVSPVDIIEAPAGTYHPCLVDMAYDTLNALTTPEEPVDDETKRLRIAGTIATLQSQLRQK